MIYDIFQLYGEIFGSTEEVVGDSDRAESRIEKSLFKDTECGIRFRVFEYDSRICVGVAGYASWDACCEEIVLEFGKFTIEEFWSAVQQADDEGVEMFNEWNADG